MSLASTRTDHVRDRRIQVLVNDAEHAAIVEAAKAASMDVGPYLRSLALGPQEGAEEAMARKLIEETLTRMANTVDRTVVEVGEALERIRILEERGAA